MRALTGSGTLITKIKIQLSSTRVFKGYVVVMYLRALTSYWKINSCLYLPLSIPNIFLAHSQTTLVFPIHAIMAVRAFWERKGTMFAAALQRLLALHVKASPIYEHVREKRGEVFITASNFLEHISFSRRQC